MRLIMIAGKIGSGKTTVIKAIGKGHRFSFIANNEESSSELADMCENVDFFPFRSPCARVRQFGFRFDLMSQNSPETVICEPPGTCLEVSSPMVNPIYLRKNVDIGPMVSVVKSGELKEKVDKDTTDGLRTFNMINESDIIVITFSDGCDENERKKIVQNVSSVNSDAETIFFDESDCRKLSKLIFEEGKYRRPLVY